MKQTNTFKYCFVIPSIQLGAGFVCFVVKEHGLIYFTNTINT
jgi:hypothetical protein